VQVVWFKRDLRVQDHAPLREAAARGAVLCLYVYEPEIIGAPETDPSHLRFIDESLAELEARLGELGGRLTYRFGAMPDVLEALHQQRAITSLYAHEETGTERTFDRDRRVRAWARERGVRFVERPQTGVVRGLKMRDGWSRHWADRMGRPPKPAPQKITPVDGIEPEGRRSLQDLGHAESDKGEAQPGGENRGWDTLSTFLHRRGVAYRSDMSSPLEGWDGSSRISPYLAYGNLSMRQVHAETKARVAELREAKRRGQLEDRRWLPSLSSFESRLRWHCHFMQKLEDEPRIEHEAMNRALDGLRDEARDPELMDAYRAARTGYPMVDACLRALFHAGWINFRMRAMLVSFASYHLWQPWRPTALFLARHFLDFEPGIHYSQVQMQSGTTGINAIRIYSPQKQVLDQDPEGRFIRRYVPELEGVPAEYLPYPERMPSELQRKVGCVIGRDYPAPIVDHGVAYQSARKRMYRARARPEVKAEAERVQRRHGSRKGRRSA
jgi:deoxyribodipyrimidine photo-lyase